ncbi:hypothetical protein NQZ68_000415, partial [Dissostichus eleginoides]
RSCKPKTTEGSPDCNPNNTHRTHGIDIEHIGFHAGAIRPGLQRWDTPRRDQEPG